MAPIFAQEDIEALIRHFPPLSLAENKPALVRSLSNNNLVDFGSALSKLEAFLERGDSRIQVSNIGFLLGVEKDAEKSILNQCSLQLYFSEDGRSLIPVPIADSIHQDLSELARTSFVDLGTFAARQDIALGSIEQWIKFDAGAEWQTFTIEEKRILCHQDLRSKIEARIRQAIIASGSDVCNVSASFEDEVQTPILQLLVDLTTKGQGGDVMLDGANVIYVPSEYSAAAEERYRQSQLDQVHLITTELEDNRFCVVKLPATDKDTLSGPILDLHELERAVRQKFEEWHPEGTQLRSVGILPASGDRLRKPVHEAPSRLLVDSGVLQHELGRLRAAALAVVEDVWSERSSYPEAANIIQSLRGTASPRPGLAQHLLRSECTAELEHSARERIDELQQKVHVDLIQTLDARLLVPFHLYATGINTILDPTLREHLEETAYEHFRKEVIPQTIKVAEDSKLLREKSNQREVEKLRQATLDAKTFPTLQANIAKFAKKMKISTPASESTKVMRIRTLQQSVKSMRQMTRGSDVLQNLIWILLAQQSGGLFKSAGKDTSRMITQYQAVGDAEMASRLVQWRNLLKAGDEGKEDLQMMRDVAKLAVEQITAAEP